MESTKNEHNDCGHCGRALAIKRITLKTLFYDTLNVVFNIEKGFLFTAKELFVKPHLVLSDYLKTSNRYKHYNPFRYAFILGTLSAFLYVYFGLYEKAISIGVVNMQASDFEALNVIEKYANIISLLIIPFMSLASYLVFRKHNYAEHMVANFFVFGQATLIGLVFFPFNLAWPELMLYQQGISTLVLYAYATYFFYKVYNQKLVFTFLKVMAILLLGIFTFGLTAAVAAFGYKVITNGI
ncbi:MAG: hypothetical protein ACPGLV_01530 [Bacteroidia bacterium]